MTQQILSGILLDDQTELSLHDLCQVCSSSTAYIIELVEEGVLEPLGERQTQWRFSVSSLQRARTAARLQRDLEINLAGVALVLDLLDDIADLRAQMRRIKMKDYG